MRADVNRQPPEKRSRDFEEVSRGLSEDQARREAGRCLQCRNAPCSMNCPVHIDIPAFIKLIGEGEYCRSLDKIKEKNNLPAICGRVCPQEDQCEGACVLAKKGEPINIGALERYASDFGHIEGRGKTEDGGKQPKLPAVAVVGSGPSGLTCAADLAKCGYRVTLFESLHRPGGVLVYGIPEFRLPKSVVHAEIEYIMSLGVRIETDVLIGMTRSLQELISDGYRAVFIGAGAGLPHFMNIPGEHLVGVYSANEFLTRVNLMKAYQFPAYDTPLDIGTRVAVIGGGNVALDAARSAVRLGSAVTLVYRRTEAQMPGRREEIINARDEGVSFQFLTQPVALTGSGDGRVTDIACIRMELGEPDESGRRRPVPVPGSDFSVPADTVIVAIGQSPNPLLARMTPGLKTGKNGTIVVDDSGMTSVPGVFAGGDIVTGADTVISAMGAGKKAALSIDAYMRARKY